MFGLKKLQELIPTITLHILKTAPPKKYGIQLPKKSTGFLPVAFWSKPPITAIAIAAIAMARAASEVADSISASKVSIWSAAEVIEAPVAMVRWPEGDPKMLEWHGKKMLRIRQLSRKRWF